MVIMTGMFIMTRVRLDSGAGTLTLSVWTLVIATQMRTCSEVGVMGCWEENRRSQCNLLWRTRTTKARTRTGLTSQVRNARCESKRVNNPRARDILNFIHSFCGLSLFCAVFIALQSRLTFLVHVQISPFQAQRRRRIKLKSLPQYHPLCMEFVRPQGMRGARKRVRCHHHK
jgi:hypothetical protein